MRRIHSFATLIAASASCLTAPAWAATVSIGEHGEFRVDGEPFLPIMQWLQSASRMEYQKTLGINTFVGNGGSESSAEYLAECQAQGVWCVLDPEDMSVSGDPALLGWIFGDEPDLESNAVEPARILEQYEAIKAEDDAHVTLLTLTSGFFGEMDAPDWMNGDRSRYYAYADASDAVGFDLYPVYGWCRPDWLYRVGAAQQELVSEYAPDRATYQWIECARTSSQWCDIGEREPDDGPSAAEVRNEVWQAIVHGAKAIGYFTHSWECDDYTQFCLSAEQEVELTRTNAQLTALTLPILAAPYEQAVTVSATEDARIDWSARRLGDELIVIAVNLETSAADATVHVPGLASGSSVEVYDEERSLGPDGETFTDRFDALAVHIYRMPLDRPDTGTGGSGSSGGASSGGEQSSGVSGTSQAGSAGDSGGSSGGASSGGEDSGPSGSAGDRGRSTGGDASGGERTTGESGASQAGSAGARGAVASGNKSDGGDCGCRTPGGRLRRIPISALAALTLLVCRRRRRSAPERGQRACC